MPTEPTTLPRPCRFKRPYCSGDWEPGILHAWGTDNESNEISMPVPIGVVEDKAGQVHSVDVNHISFAVESPEVTG